MYHKRRHIKGISALSLLFQKKYEVFLVFSGGANGMTSDFLVNIVLYIVKHVRDFDKPLKSYDSVVIFQSWATLNPR